MGNATSISFAINKVRAEKQQLEEMKRYQFLEKHGFCLSLYKQGDDFDKD